jgi:hypothetical protein
LRRMTKRRSCGSYRLRWPCKPRRRLRPSLLCEHGDCERRGVSGVWRYQQKLHLGLLASCSSFLYIIVAFGLWISVEAPSQSTYEIRGIYLAIPSSLLFVYSGI